MSCGVLEVFGDGSDVELLNELILNVFGGGSDVELLNELWCSGSVRWWIRC